jgi:hypothetical protein
MFGISRCLVSRGFCEAWNRGAGFVGKGRAWGVEVVVEWWKGVIEMSRRIGSATSKLNFKSADFAKLGTHEINPSVRYWPVVRQNAQFGGVSWICVREFVSFRSNDGRSSVHPNNMVVNALPIRTRRTTTSPCPPPIPEPHPDQSLHAR